jgi:hypothetical protein
MRFDPLQNIDEVGAGIDHVKNTLSVPVGCVLFESRAIRTGAELDDRGFPDLTIHVVTENPAEPL